MVRGFVRFGFVVGVVVVLAGCAATERARQAAEARRAMVGMTKEEVLACMGPAKKTAQQGATEVWSYSSTNDASQGYSFSQRSKELGTALGTSYHAKAFCTVNIVMHDGTVSAVHYNGPRHGGYGEQDEQCGFAVEHCVE